MNDMNRYNTFWKRVLAGLIDTLVFLPLIIVGYIIEPTNNIIIYIAWNLLNIVLWMIYIVIGHGKYGQTLGKKLMQIKVMDINEQTTIGYGRAFIRELIWVLAEISGMVYLVYLSSTTAGTDEQLITRVYENYLSWTTLGWFLLEIITMLLNKKRRALHDYIAGSVVVRI